LLLAAAELTGAGRQTALPFASALELIHTYSLIHDDLPCMDDDDLRRGRPTCHKVFGEAIAVLAGDYLLNRAYEILLDAIDPAQPGSLAAARLISRAAGSHGMIGGQVLDLQAGGRMISPEQLCRIHTLKTGALLLAPLLAGARLGRADPATEQVLTRYGRSIGLAFQIRDDILDVTANAGTLGKSAGKDERDGKATYVSHYGLAGAETKLQEITGQAQQALAELKSLGFDPTFLVNLTRFLLIRSH
jgi:geranylgeranyl diphosphate synthase type II